MVRVCWQACTLERKRGCAMMRGMVRTLEKAIAEVSNLPDADQEQIGQRLLSHVEKLQRLRAEIDKGILSLDAGEGDPLDIEDFLQQKNGRHGRS
jgi:hypothetical protein